MAAEVASRIVALSGLSGDMNLGAAGFVSPEAARGGARRANQVYVPRIRDDRVEKPSVGVAR